MSPNHARDWMDQVDVIFRSMRKKPSVITIQMPEGLKRKASEISAYLRKKYRVKTVISGDPCYGACDLPSDIFDQDDGMILHFGHTEIPTLLGRKITGKIDVRHIVIPFDNNVSSSVYDKLKSMLDKNHGVRLIATSQGTHILPALRGRLADDGFCARIAAPGTRCVYPGQVLGCDLTAAIRSLRRSDQLVYVGSGRFHPLGVSLAAKRAVIVIDIETDSIDSVSWDSDRFLRRRWALIQKSKGARRIGIILSSKNGQARPTLARKLERFAIESGLDAHVVSLREVTPAQLQNLGFDVYVSTACPRIAIEDSERYPRPLLTPQEFEILLGKRDWDDYEIDRF